MEKELPQIDKQLDYWRTERSVAQRMEMVAQQNIERLMTERMHIATTTPFDLLPLKQSMLERLLQGLDSILDRISPG